MTPKQHRFCEEYLIDLNATQAAMRAGYSPSTAHKKNPIRAIAVQQRIEELKTERRSQLMVRSTDVLRELAAIAFADIRDYVAWNGENAEARPSATLTKEQAAAIAEISRSTTGVKVKLHGKLTALKLLGEHLGMFTSQEEQETQVQVTITIADHQPPHTPNPGAAERAAAPGAV